MTADVLLTFNPGSSTIKLGFFEIAGGAARRLGRGEIDLRRGARSLRVEEGGRAAQVALDGDAGRGGGDNGDDDGSGSGGDDLHAILDQALGWTIQHFPHGRIAGVGHRVVHGGRRFGGPARLDDAAIDAIEALVPLAPLHQPQSVRLIRALRRLRPDLAQVASFDTAFHRTQPELVRRFALPRALFDEGIERYGFHGLSYRHIAGRLAREHPDLGAGRVVAAHLGSGASLCAMRAGVSLDTSMGFSTLDGVPMATRCGTLDVGVVLHLLRQRALSPEAVEDMLYRRSGLLGVSGISADSRELLASAAPEAREALDLFAHRVARETAALAGTVGGLDAIVFTAGIGEHQPPVRASICERLAWLGVSLDAQANAAGRTRIDAAGSRVAVLVIAADEEQVIADEALSVLRPPST